MRSGFDEFRMETSRWTNRAITPLRFNSKSDMSKEIVLLHPGWGKRPEMLKHIMNALAERGKMPIGLDTRFGYANAQSEGRGLLHQRYRVGSENPYYTHASAWDNRYRLRRPTAVLAIAEALDIESASLFGHSEGGRVMATVAIAPKRFHIPKLVVVNGVGTGSTQGVTGQVRSNFDNNELFRGQSFGLLSEAIPSALESTAYAVSHPRRWLREKDVIEREYLWPTLDEAALINGVSVAVLHAKDDRVISFSGAVNQASNRPHLAFVPTEGGHSNVYTLEQAQFIADLFKIAA